MPSEAAVAGRPMDRKTNNLLPIVRRADPGSSPRAGERRPCLPFLHRAPGRRWIARVADAPEKLLADLKSEEEEAFGLASLVFLTPPTSGRILCSLFRARSSSGPALRLAL